MIPRSPGVLHPVQEKTPFKPPLRTPGIGYSIEYSPVPADGLDPAVPLQDIQVFAHFVHMPARGFG